MIFETMLSAGLIIEFIKGNMIDTMSWYIYEQLIEMVDGFEVCRHDKWSLLTN